MRRLTCVLLCVLPLLFGASLAQAEKRVALVIGNSAYQQVTTLANPTNDADDMAAALKTLGFDVIESHDLNQAGMLATIRRFTEALQGSDAGLFYYAGHGLEVGNTNYLVPVDAELASEGDLAFEAVKLDLVLEQLEREAKTALRHPAGQRGSRRSGAQLAFHFGAGEAYRRAGQGLERVHDRRAQRCV